MQRILLMMSDTGGGHRASAQALKAGYEELYPGRFQIEIVDVITDYLPFPLNQIPKTYPFLSNDAPWLWKLLYSSQDPLSFGNGLMVSGSWLAQGGARRLLEEKRPDLIVSVHPLFQLVTQWVMAKMAWRRPFVTVVTDLTTGHPRWFDPGVDACYVPSQVTYDLARRAGLRPDQLFLFGLPIRPAFARAKRPRRELRAALKMQADLPAVLLIGGGEGVGPVEEIAAHLAQQLSAGGSAAGQVVVICGRNKALQERLQARTWPIPVTVNGFVDNMPDWMAACDCVVTKAGPGTIAEALISGLPIVLSGFIPGQEEGNVPFVVDNGVGAYSPEPRAIAEIVARWFGPEREELPVMAARARELGHPQATFDIVRSTVELLEAFPHASVG